MKTEFTIAEIIHIAADCHLSVDGYYENRTQRFSCCAIHAAILECVYGNVSCNQWNEVEAIENKIVEGLTALGVEVDSTSQFDEFEVYAERQGARYAWLKFVALLAEEQGV